MKTVLKNTPGHHSCDTLGLHTVAERLDPNIDHLVQSVRGDTRVGLYALPPLLRTALQTACARGEQTFSKVTCCRAI